jgi:Tfp pilus assembly PilM family ATPase
MNIRSILRQPVLTLAIHDLEARWTLGRRGRIACSGRIPLADELVDDGVVRDPEAVGATLMASPGFQASARLQTVVALPAQRSVFRQLELPALRGHQFAELVEREIRREMPMLADNAYVSWKRTGTFDGKAQVFVVGVARDVLDSHIATARAAGLQPLAADLRIVATARAVGQADCIVAHTESNEIEIGIFRDGVPSIVRHIVMASPVADEAWGAQLGEELARTLKFYRDSHRDDEVVPGLPISFVGGVAQQAILAERLTASTGHEVALPPLALAVSPEDQAACFAANVGLAIKELAA